MLKKPEWYVIQVVSWTEENVTSSLLQRKVSYGIEDYLLDVFVPTHDEVSVKASWDKVIKKKNILPWYLLVQMIVTNESWYIVRNTPNVTWFLWAWNVPVPVSWEELEKLKWEVKNQAWVHDIKEKVGDLVNIIKWPFTWNEWKIKEINDKKATVKVIINLMWRDTQVDIEISDIAPIKQ
jgi:transcriptional antiterminator NusG